MSRSGLIVELERLGQEIAENFKSETELKIFNLNINWPARLGRMRLTLIAVDENEKPSEILQNVALLMAMGRPMLGDYENSINSLSYTEETISSVDEAFLSILALSPSLPGWDVGVSKFRSACGLPVSP